MKILGLGRSIPKQIVTNDDLAKIIDTSDEWIVKRTGIKERRISDVNTTQLAYEASLIAIKNSKINKEDIDLIICATVTPEYITPSLACAVQEKLGIESEVMAFDINAACTGFIYALKITDSLFKSGHKTALVIGAETLSKILNFENRDTCVLFGDGAGAAIVQSDGKDMKYTTYSNGNSKYIKCNNIELNPNMEPDKQKAGSLEMDGREVFKFATKVMEESIVEILEKNGLTFDDIKLIIPHQANVRIIEMVAKKLNLDISKFYVNLENYGNTSSATIPIALSEAIENKYLKSGDKALLVGFGAGLTWGATIIEI